MMIASVTLISGRTRRTAFYAQPLFTIFGIHIDKTELYRAKRGLGIVFGARSGKARTRGRGSARSARSHDSVAAQTMRISKMVFEIFDPKFWELNYGNGVFF